MNFKIKARQVSQPSQCPLHHAGHRGGMDMQLFGDGTQAHPLKEVHHHHLPLPLGQLGFDRPVQKTAVFLSLALVGASAEATGQVGIMFDIFNRNLFAHDSPPYLILREILYDLALIYHINKKKSSRKQTNLAKSLAKSTGKW
jgi:hypothetical protein